MELIEAIKYELPPIKVSTISKKLGVTEDYVRRRIKKIEKAGLGFRINFDLRKIGLSTVLVIFEKPLNLDLETRIKGIDKNLSYILRWHGNINFPRPMGLAMFYVPYNIEVKDNLVRLLEKKDLPKVIEAIETDVSKYDDFNLKEEITSHGLEGKWKKVLDEYQKNKKDQQKIDTNYQYEQIEQKHIDLIDLVILAKLQMDSLTPMTEIARLLNVSVSKVNRHLQTHLISQKIIESNSLRKRILNRENPENLLFIVKGKTDYIDLMEHIISDLSKFWEFLSATYNSRTGDYVVLFMMKTYDVEKIDKYLHRIFGEVLGGEYFIGVLNKNSIKSYTIPFISFNREERNWDLDLQLMDVMRQKLLDILKY
ncbi:MAG: hypothetical protein ACP5J1_04975 [Fervidicoccaceae archaeon]